MNLRGPVYPAFCSICFFFNDTATTEIYTLSLHDALPISHVRADRRGRCLLACANGQPRADRSEEHTSEHQSQSNIVCRLLLEKKILTAYLKNSINIFLYIHSRSSMGCNL